jgi:hypothetical protein
VAEISGRNFGQWDGREIAPSSDFKESKLTVIQCFFITHQFSSATNFQKYSKPGKRVIDFRIIIQVYALLYEMKSYGEPPANCITIATVSYCLSRDVMT